MHKRIIAALKLILIQADFKTAVKKFEETCEPVDAPTIKGYINKFKQLRDSHRISQVEQKDINYWAKKGFPAFKEFIDSTSKTKSKNKLKKDIHKVGQQIPGANLIAENESWLVYEILKYQAAQLLGSRNWCIVREEHHWEDYTKGDPCYNFYFVLAKDRPEDEYYKIAVCKRQDGDDTCFDFNDKEKDWTTVREELGNIPEFDMETPEEHCDNCHEVKRDCTCCRLCGASDEDCGCCPNCKQREGRCTCCPECGNEDKYSCGCYCRNCDELINDCNCCPLCEDNDKDTCGCCLECESDDKTKCGCWCPECDALIKNNYKDCTCDRCDDCEHLINGPKSDNCDCERCDDCEKLVDDYTCEEKTE